MGKYFSFHYSDKNLLYFILLYIAMHIIFNIVEKNTDDNDDNNNDEDDIENKSFTFKTLLTESLGRIFYFIGDIIYNRHLIFSKDKYYKDNEKYKYKYKFKDIVTIITISFIILLGNFSEALLDLKRKSSDELEHLTFYLAFLAITKLLSKSEYYRHQYFSIISFIILGFVRFFFEKFINDELYDVKLYSLLIEIPLNLICNVCKWTSYIYFQKFMIDYYYSPFKIIFLFGLINSFIIFIIYLVVSFIPCKGNAKNLFCSIKYENQYYFDNIFAYFDNFEITDFLINFAFCLAYPAYDAFIIYIIKIYPICYAFFPVQISLCIEFVQKILEFSKEETEVNEVTISVYIFTYIVEIFITLVFIEVLEVKICGLNKYIKRNIRTRSLVDVLSTLQPQRDTTDIETDEGYSIELEQNEEMED